MHYYYVTCQVTFNKPIDSKICAIATDIAAGVLPYSEKLTLNLDMICQMELVVIKNFLNDLGLKQSDLISSTLLAVSYWGEMDKFSDEDEDEDHQ